MEFDFIALIKFVPNYFFAIIFTVCIALLSWLFVRIIGEKSTSGNKSSTEEYIRSIGVRFDCQDKIKAAFNIAAQNRLEDMNNYRSTSLYFYGFQGALIGSILYISSAVMGNEKFNEQYFPYILFFLAIIACFGLIFALLWALAEISSRRWQENWERHIDYLEPYVTGNVYKTVLFDSSSLFPRVGVIKQIVTLLIIFFWFLVIFILMGMHVFIMCIIVDFICIALPLIALAHHIIKKRGTLMLESRTNDNVISKTG